MRITTHNTQVQEFFLPCEDCLGEFNEYIKYNQFEENIDYVLDICAGKSTEGYEFVIFENWRKKKI